MSTLEEGRTALATALTGDGEFVKAHAYVPEDMPAPCVVLQPADRYVLPPGDDVTFSDGDYVQVLEVWIVLEPQSNETAADDTDTYLEHVLAHLPTEWGLDAIGRPGPIVTAGWSGHGCRLTVSRHITL